MAETIKPVTIEIRQEKSVIFSKDFNLSNGDTVTVTHVSFGKEIDKWKFEMAEGAMKPSA